MPEGRTIQTARGRAFPVADRELTATEVRASYGTLIELFDRAIRQDPGLLAQMAERATEILRKQAKRKAKAEKERSSRPRSGREEAARRGKTSRNVAEPETVKAQVNA